MLACIDRFYEEMMKRSEDMKLMENYRTGENYAYLGLPANFLIFDEYVAFMEMLGTKENAAVLNKLKQIVMLGRQAGFFLILACQRPDAKYLGDGIRDQFNFRVALGRMSEMGYGMMFGETTKDFFLKQIKGRGYVDVGTSVISEFYTPLVPKGHDFLKEIKTDRQQAGSAGGVRSESRRNGLTCCGWCAARHASINPSYLTEGYKSTGNNQTTGQNPTVHKGFSPYPACVNKALKVDIRFLDRRDFH